MKVDLEKLHDAYGGMDELYRAAYARYRFAENLTEKYHVSAFIRSNALALLVTRLQELQAWLLDMHYADLAIVVRDELGKMIDLLGAAIEQAKKEKAEEPKRVDS